MRLTRLREKGSSDRAALDTLLDAARVGHFGVTGADGEPVVFPTAIARDGDRVLIHGSTGSRWMRRLAEKSAALDLVTEHLLPGRTDEVRRPTRGEVEATLVLALPMDEWSLKVSDTWPDDPDDDVAGDAWAGVVPVVETLGAPQPAPDLRPGIPLPPSLG